MAALLHEEGQLATYSIAGCQYDVGSPGFVEAIARAHAEQRRPRCMCTRGGIETYVAKVNDGYVLKRMPETGNQHAATCPHFEPAAEASGLAALSSTAIREDPVTGLTSLKLGFILSRSSPRIVSSPTSVGVTPKKPCGPRLSMRGLLLYLWEQAGLMRWQPSFAGKRSWATVRRRLLQAVAGKLVGGQPLLARLFVPEPFSVDQREALNRRLATFWSMAAPNAAASGQLLLLIGELKEITPARCGFKAVIKQMPDQGFIIDERLYSRITRSMQAALSLWNADDQIRMLVIATFTIGASGVPAVRELALAPTTREWLPVDDVFQQRLVDRLVAEERSFLRTAQLDPRSHASIPCVTLIDCTNSIPQLFVVANADEAPCDDRGRGLRAGGKWTWLVAEGAMPFFPSH